MSRSIMPQLVVMATRNTAGKTKKSVERNGHKLPSAMGALKWPSRPHCSFYLIGGFVLIHFITALYLIYKATLVDLKSPLA